MTERGFFRGGEEYLTSHRAPVFSLYEVVGKGLASACDRDQLRSGETIAIDQGMNLTIDKEIYGDPVISGKGLRLTAGVGIRSSGDRQALVENFKWLYDQKKIKWIGTR
ncbi:MAG: hypothetical protein IPN90_12075 [Elusimicrobia bacterium]|nr:hypothetical protein [Elusimicrobiota bacterium]